MKKKVTFLMLTLVAMVASISFTSCDKDDEPTYTDNYYLQLTSVQSNLVNQETGESLDSALKEEFIAGSDLDSSGKFSIGKTSKENAVAAFNQSISNFKQALSNAYVGKNILPNNGYIDYNFVLKNNSGSIVQSTSIRVTNTAASIH